MTILDRFVVWNFIKLFVMSCVLLAAIFVILDIVDNFDDFFGKGSFSETAIIFGKYYMFHIFPILDIFLPFLLMCAAIALLRSMDQGNEIIALMASGVSRVRLLLPLFASAFFFACFFFFFREFIIPMNLLDLVKAPEDYFRKEEAVKVCQMEDQVTGLRLSGELAYTADKKITNPIIILPPDLSQKTQSLKIVAKEAFWKPAIKDLPQGFLFSNISVPSGLSSEKSLFSTKAGKKVILTAADYPEHLKPNECFVATDIPFEVLQAGTSWTKGASIASLMRALSNASISFNRHQLEIEIHSRLVRPFTDIIPFFICIPLIFFRNVKNMAKNILFGVFITFVYIGFQFVSAFLGQNLDATLSSWLHILVFAPIGFAVYYDLIVSPKVLLVRKKRKPQTT